MGAMLSRSRNLPSVSLALPSVMVIGRMMAVHLWSRPVGPTCLRSFICSLIVLAIYWLLTCRPTVKQLCTEKSHVNIGVVQFNNFKWNLDLVFKVIVHTKWKLWLLFPFPHIVSFFRGSQRGLFEVCPGHAFQYNEREWDGQASKETEKCDLCTVFQVFWSYMIAL